MTNNTYKSSSIGQIPSDWEVRKLGNFAKFFSGGTPLTSKSEYYEGNIPFIKSGEIYFNETEQFISEEGLNSSSAKMVEVGDILYALYGANSGEVAISKIKGAINQAILCIRHNEACNTVFLYNYLLSQKKSIISTYLQGGQGNLSAEIVKSLSLPLPPLPEQKAIAHILGLIDNLINKNDQLIAQKELRKKWLMQNLLTGKMRLKGFSGEWKKEKLENYLIKHDEKTTVNNQYPVLTSSRRGIFLQSEYYTRDVASEDNTGYNVVPRGYFTYRHMSDDLIFKFNINDIVDKGIVSTLYPVFTTKNINDYFLLAKLNEGHEFKMHAGEQKQGGSRTYVYFKTLCQLKMNLPSLAEQTAISQVLQAADKEISLLKAKAEKLREQKKGLMHVLLTGKKRLKL